MKRVDANGKINVFHLKVPLVLALGQYEKVPTKELLEHARDISAELKRRKE